MEHRLWLSFPLHVEVNAECTLFKKRELMWTELFSAYFACLFDLFPFFSPLVTCHLFFLHLLSKSLHGILPLAWVHLSGYGYPAYMVTQHPAMLITFIDLFIYQVTIFGSGCPWDTDPGGLEWEYLCTLGPDLIVFLQHQLLANIEHQIQGWVHELSVWFTVGHVIGKKGPFFGTIFATLCSCAYSTSICPQHKSSLTFLFCS